MTETKHTPGPWVASKFGAQVLTGDSWNSICTLSGGAEWEDKRGSYTPDYTWQNQEANARLIAAAPDLLEAVQSLHAFVGAMFGVGADAVIPDTVPTPLGVPVKVGAIMADATAALAKALPTPHP